MAIPFRVGAVTQYKGASAEGRLERIGTVYKNQMKQFMSYFDQEPHLCRHIVLNNEGCWVLVCDIVGRSMDEPNSKLN